VGRGRGSGSGPATTPQQRRTIGSIDAQLDSMCGMTNSEDAAAIDEMIRRGEFIPAKDPSGLVGLKPLPARDGPSLTEVCLAMREEEDR
jgi:hypothetical protein